MLSTINWNYICLYESTSDQYCRILKGDLMENKYGKFVFKKKDLEIESNDGTQFFVDPEKVVCLYKIPYRPDGEGEGLRAISFQRC